MGYVPPRDAAGNIIVGPLPTALLDEEAPTAPAPPPPTAPGPPAPPRRPGDTPTAFDALRPGPPPPVGQAAAWPTYLAAALVVALLALALWSLRGQAPAAPPAVAEAAPTAASAAPTGTAWPALGVALVAYDSPGGRLLGALEPGRPYLVVGRAGEGWLQIDVGAPGAPNVVWVERFLVELPAVPDLATPTPLPTPTARPYVAPAPAYVPLPDPAYVAPTAIPQATCKPSYLDGEEIGMACGYSQAEILATHEALISTPRGGVPVEVVTRVPLDPAAFPTARP